MISLTTIQQFEYIIDQVQGMDRADAIGPVHTLHLINYTAIQSWLCLVRPKMELALSGA